MVAVARASFLVTSSLLLRSRPGQRLPHRALQPRLAAPVCTECGDDSSAKSEGSVSGVIYAAADADEEDRPTINLFTKAGCTLCDKAKDVLARASEEEPHTLVAVDITDESNAIWWDRYKYDIPVLHINGMYWAKHRISYEQAVAALTLAREGEFEPMTGAPDAARFERQK